MKSLEARGYVATEADIEALARHNIEAREAHHAVRATYLRALISTAQHELAKPGKRVAHLRTIPNQIDAVQRVHERFYAIVMRVVVTPDVQDLPRLTGEEKHRRALERNRRSGFARSSKSTLIAWLRQPGHDLMKLNAVTVSKGSLHRAVPRSKKPPRPSLLRKQTHGAIKKFHRLTETLARTDPEHAITVLNAALKQIQSKLNQLSRQAG